jgi:serine O-acetyltransferase
MLNLIKLDVINNYKAGVLTVFFLVNYRFGRVILKKKESNRFFWIIYIPCIFISRGLSLLFGCSVPFSAKIGSSITFKHGLFGVFISGLAEIGDGCVIFHHVTIGSNYGSKRQIGAPVIGRGVIVGAGAKVIGPIDVGENSVIGAGAAVFKDVEPGQVLKPAKGYL